MDENAVYSGTKKIVQGWSVQGLRNTVRKYDAESLTILIRVLVDLIEEGERVSDYKMMLDLVYDAQMELRAKDKGVPFKSELIGD